MFLLRLDTGSRGGNKLGLVLLFNFEFIDETAQFHPVGAVCVYPVSSERPLTCPSIESRHRHFETSGGRFISLDWNRKLGQTKLPERDHKRFPVEKDVVQRRMSYTARPPAGLQAVVMDF